MEVAIWKSNHPEQEAKILQIALRLLAEDERFHADVDEAIQQADRGQMIDHEEVKARIAQSL